MNSRKIEKGDAIFSPSRGKECGALAGEGKKKKGRETVILSFPLCLEREREEKMTDAHKKGGSPRRNEERSEERGKTRKEGNRCVILTTLFQRGRGRAHTEVKRNNSSVRKKRGKSLRQSSRGGKKRGEKALKTVGSRLLFQQFYGKLLHKNQLDLGRGEVVTRIQRGKKKKKA